MLMVYRLLSKSWPLFVIDHIMAPNILWYQTGTLTNFGTYSICTISDYEALTDMLAEDQGKLLVPEGTLNPKP